MSNKKDHTDLLLEDINSKFDAIMEVVGSMKENVKKIPIIEEKVNELEKEMIAVKLATTETNRDVKEIKIHISKIDKQLDGLEDRLITVEAVQ